ncbi:hypothetical protein JCM19231_1387 [Vibrio ishigakensis]|uniref:Uncharacterized protein n=1 Tax=Vibrio ishigakensis TaxID=1481914 RepID=A0A0B8NVD7_9VIBR|nr:hypothetical protein JCM19231_1387 [Vibrio ishigakensis]
MNFAQSIKLPTPVLLGVAVVAVYIASVMSVAVGPWILAFHKA